MTEKQWDIINDGSMPDEIFFLAFPVKETPPSNPTIEYWDNQDIPLRDEPTSKPRTLKQVHDAFEAQRDQNKKEFKGWF